jgi:hypothetical protein
MATAGLQAVLNHREFITNDEYRGSGDSNIRRQQHQATATSGDSNDGNKGLQQRLGQFLHADAARYLFLAQSAVPSLIAVLR